MDFELEGTFRHLRIGMNTVGFGTVMLLGGIGKERGRGCDQGRSSGMMMLTV